MITKTLKAKVIKEATALRGMITREEAGRLNFKILSPTDIWLCIYGQMTGYCRSKRALELLDKCGIKYSKLLSRYDKVTKQDYFSASSHTFSAIEYYIVQKGAKNDVLIDFLKGKTNELNL